LGRGNSGGGTEEGISNIPKDYILTEEGKTAMMNQKQQEREKERKKERKKEN